jgi:hypothetical protein
LVPPPAAVHRLLLLRKHLPPSLAIHRRELAVIQALEASGAVDLPAEVLRAAELELARLPLLSPPIVRFGIPMARSFLKSQTW